MEGSDVSMGTQVRTYTLVAEAGMGGSIQPAGQVSPAEGETVQFTITPDEGSAIRAVYVDGENVGPVDSYTFEAVNATHVISAEFMQNISACVITVSPEACVYDGEAHTPEVTVVKPEGETLTEGLDYELTYEDNVEVGNGTVYVEATSESSVRGVAKATFRILPIGNGIEGATYNASTGKAEVTLWHDVDAVVVVAAYDAGGAMLAAGLARVPLGENEVRLSLSGAALGSGAPESETGVEMTISSTIPTKQGWDFHRWDAIIDLSAGNYYKPGDSITLSADTTLYAVWSSGTCYSSAWENQYLPYSDSVNMDIPGGTRRIVFPSQNGGRYVFQSTGSYDTIGQVYDESGNLLATDDDSGEGKNFRIECDLEAGTYHLVVSMYSKTAAPGPIDVTLDKARYTVTYSANGGESAPSSQTKLHGQAITLSASPATWEGHTFRGWADQPGATEPVYQPGDTYG